MIFSGLLHIFQSEHYDRKRFLKFVYSHFDWWNFSVRGKVEWTLRAKITLGIILFDFIIVGIFLYSFSSFKFLGLLLFPLILFFFPFVAIIAEIIFSPLLIGFFLDWKFGVLVFLSLIIPYLCLPLLLVLADFFVRPLVNLQKKKIFGKAKILVKNSGVHVVAITGSFGKTTMKTILESVLSQKFSVLTVPGNINTDLGVANFLLQNPEKLQKSEILLVEMGAYHPGDIASVCEIVSPDYSFLTAIAPVHLERFGSVENIVKAKMELPERTKKIAYFLKDAVKKIPHKNSPPLEGCLKGGVVFSEDWCKKSHEQTTPPLLGYPSKGGEYVRISAEKSENSVEFLPNFSGLSFEWNNKKFISKLIAAHTVEQMVAALELAEELGISTEQMQKGIEKIPFPPHRLEVIKNPNTQVTVIDDSYNGNFAGFVSALETLERANGRKIVLTPGIVELGEMQEKTHLDLAKIYAEKIDVLLLVENSNTKIIEKGVLQYAPTKMIKTYKTAMDAHADLPNVLQKGDTILFQNDLPDNYR